MINADRIVPITSIDLLTAYGTMMKLAGTSVDTIEASDAGVFAVTSGSGNKLANEPVKSLDFGSGVSSMVVFFVPAFDYAGFSVAGTAVEPAEGSAEVLADAKTLYSATLSSGAVTIAKVGM